MQQNIPVNEILNTWSFLTSAVYSNKPLKLYKLSLTDQIWNKLNQTSSSGMLGLDRFLEPAYLSTDTNARSPKS